MVIFVDYSRDHGFSADGSQIGHVPDGLLQLEDGLTVSQVTERLGVARSTAHRLLAMLVYRDFAVQDDDRVYRAGPVLELAGDTARFIASAECQQALRVSSREGMVFPAHRTTAGLLLLAELSGSELDQVYAAERYRDSPAERPDLGSLRAELARVRREEFAVNRERSERGLVAVGVLVRDTDGAAQAGLSVSMPSVRCDPHQLPSLVATLGAAARRLGADLTPAR